MNKRFYLGIDVGGSHITLDLVDAATFEMLPGSTVREHLDTHAHPTAILDVFEQSIRRCAAKTGPEAVLGVGLFLDEKTVSKGQTTQRIQFAPHKPVDLHSIPVINEFFRPNLLAWDFLQRWENHLRVKVLQQDWPVCSIITAGV